MMCMYLGIYLKPMISDQQNAQYVPKTLTGMHKDLNTHICI